MAELQKAGLNGSAPLTGGLNQTDVLIATDNLLPLEVFKYTDPKKVVKPTDEIELSMEDGWIFKVNGIEITQLTDDLNDAIQGALLTLEEHDLFIKNDGGAINLVADEIELRAKVSDGSGNDVRDAVIRMSQDANGSYVLIDANTIYLGDKDGDPLTLDAVMTIDSNVVKINADLEILSDDNNRFISAGSKGLYVEDSAGTIIHDLPDEALAIGYSYLGHLLYFDGSVDTEIYADSPPLVWTTVECLTGGNSNAKGGLFKVFCSAYAAPFVTFRPLGTTWGPDFFGPAPSAYSGSVQFVTELTCPFGTNNSIEFDFTGSLPRNLVIIQLGVYI